MGDQKDFILEMMKSRTASNSTRQESLALCDCGTDNVEAETRHKPPAELEGCRSEDEPWNAEEVADETAAQKKQPTQHMLPKPTPAPPTQVHDYDFFGNPIVPQSRPPVELFSPTHEEDFSEFLEVPMEGFTKSASAEQGIKAIHRGCVGEFGHFIVSSFCCTADSSADEIESSDRALEDLASLNTLNDSVRNAKTRRTLLQFELKSHLNELKRQNSEVEESYNAQIAAELSRKTILQTQLNEKLINMMKERMALEMQLKNAQLHLPMVVGTPSPASTTASPSKVPMDPSPGGTQSANRQQQLEHKLKCMPKTRPVTNSSPFGLSIVVENQDSYLNSPSAVGGETSKAPLVVPQPEVASLPVATPVAVG